jgi:predicted glycoside hydrolase/deacetylase ChbG (UPF0249 family)
VNEAIATACRDGIVTSASLLVTAGGFESAVEIARRQSGLDLGLHLNLTEGRPVSDPDSISSIAGRDGFLHSHPVRLAIALLRGKIRASDLEKEIRAQIERAIGSGLWITHIDGHKHVHVMPALLRILRRVAPEYDIHAIRLLHERMPRFAAMLTRNRKASAQIVKQRTFGKILSSLSGPAGSSAGGREGVVSPEYFYGITQTGFLDLAAFTDIVCDLREGTNELMCHPGYVDEDLNKTPTRLRTERERELELLTGPEVRSLIRQAGVTLISYRDLVEKNGNRRPNPVLHRRPAL